MIVIYVDDILISSNNTMLQDKLLRSMGESFKLLILGQAKWILGMQVSYSINSSITIDQEKYLTEVLTRFGMENSKPVGTPAIQEERRDQEETVTDQGEYLKLIGSLIYLLTVTCPDISFTVGKAGRAMADPRQSDMVAGKRIL